MKTKKGRAGHNGKREIREETRLTRPPRLEGVVKNAAKPEKKPKGFHAKTPRAKATPEKTDEWLERFE